MSDEGLHIPGDAQPKLQGGEGDVEVSAAFLCVENITGTNRVANIEMYGGIRECINFCVQAQVESKIERGMRRHTRAFTISGRSGSGFRA